MIAGKMGGGTMRNFVMEKGKVVLYQPDNSIKLGLRMESETVWLTQAQMALLFGCPTYNVGLHLKNVYGEHEIDTISTSEEISLVSKEGKRNISNQFQLDLNRHNSQHSILKLRMS